MKKYIVLLLLLPLLSYACAQDNPEEGLPNNEFIVQINTQVGAHNHHGWKEPVTGIGLYAGYAHFWDAHRLSGGIELAYRNSMQFLLIPDYHYEWIVNRFRTALGLNVMAGYCLGMGFAGGIQPSWEIGCFVSSNFSITLSTGYRMIGYSHVPETTKAEAGNLIFEIPVELNFRF